MVVVEDDDGSGWLLDGTGTGVVVVVVVVVAVVAITDATGAGTPAAMPGIVVGGGG